MRKKYEMSAEQCAALIAAMQPVPLIMLQCGMPKSQQENANDAWRKLGDAMGFDGMTVEPCHGEGSRVFTAEEAPTTNAKEK